MELLKSALALFVQEACSILSKINIPERRWLRVVFKDEPPIGWHWSTEVEQRPDMFSLAWHFVRETPALVSSAILLKVLEDDPELSAKFHPERESPADWLGGKYLKNDVWNALLGPYIEECLKEHGRVLFAQGIFDRIFAETIDDVQSPSLAVETHLIPVGKIFLSQTEPIELEPGFRLRQLTAEEIEKWLNRTWQLDTKLRIDEFSGLQCAIEITYQQSREDFSLEHSVDRMLKEMQAAEKELNKVDKLLGLLRLITNQNPYIALTQVSRRSLLQRSMSISLPKTPRPSQFNFVRDTIDSALAERLAKLWQTIRAGTAVKNYELAFRRWSQATDRLNDVDRLIDYWIGLEALFMPDSNAELSFRVSLRVAAFLGDNPDQWEKIYKDIRHSYNWRSAVVHGSSSSKEKELSKEGTLQVVTTKTKEYLRSALLRLLESNEPMKNQPGESEIEFLRRLGG